jgi:hypothetical protein
VTQFSSIAYNKVDPILDSGRVLEQTHMNVSQTKKRQNKEDTSRSSYEEERGKS